MRGDRGPVVVPRASRHLRIEPALWAAAKEKARVEEGTTLSAKIRGWCIAYVDGRLP